jgi:hypothetical protein
MKYERFEDPPVWKAAVELAARIYALTERRCFKQNSDIKGQRYLNEKTRSREQMTREREELLEEPRNIQEKKIASARQV